MLARLRRTWGRALVYAQVVGAALLLSFAVGAARLSDGEPVVLALAAAGALIGVGLLRSARRDARRRR